MAVFFWYLPCDMYKGTVAYTGQVTFYKVPEKHGHVYLVGLYLNFKGTHLCFQGRAMRFTRRGKFCPPPPRKISLP